MPRPHCGPARRPAAEWGLFAPLVIDWRSDRRGQADWRALTVTEDGRRLTTEEASGHRLRIGPRQWLFYRSLRKSAEPRAVLGHTPHETLIGRFDSSGEVEPILLSSWW